MYIESKANGLNGPVRIAQVTFSKIGRTIYDARRKFKSLKRGWFKTDYFDVGTGEQCCFRLNEQWLERIATRCSRIFVARVSNQ